MIVNICVGHGVVVMGCNPTGFVVVPCPLLGLMEVLILGC